jgi:EAL and modified HD-GYP domain-containing signal transduction protein
MLRSLLDRLLRRPPARPAPRGSVRPRVVASTEAAQADEPGRVAVGAYRPLISARGEIAGFEFRIADAALQRLAGRADPMAARAGASSLLAAMRLCAKAGQVAYAEIPLGWIGLIDGSEWLPGMHAALMAPEDAAGIDPTAIHHALVAWRTAGAAIGWASAGAPTALAAEVPDFLLLPRDDDPSVLMAALRHCRETRPGVALLAPHLPNLAVLEATLQAGITYAACRTDGPADPREARALPPQARHLLALMARLARDADTAEVVAAVKADVGLSYRLLRQLNSAAVAPGVELGSIEQAVAMLGRNELYRWVSVLLVRQGPQRPAAPALQAMALARARFFELLAEARGDTPAGALFTLGLASLLPKLLQTSMEEALASLQLHPHAEEALMQRQGPWRHHLVLAEMLDEGDLVEAAALAEAEGFGPLPEVMGRSARAWLFAGGATAAPSRADRR